MTARSTGEATSGSPSTDLARRRAARASSVAAAVAAAVGVWVLAVPVAGVDLAVTMQGETQSIGVLPVIAASLAAGLLGWAALAVLESWLPRVAARLWAAAALAVTVLSLVGPLTAAGSTGATIAMMALHLVVAAVLVPLLLRTALRR